MPILEGRFSVLAAINARQRTFERVLIADSADPEKIGEVINECAKYKITVERPTMEVAAALAHGKLHGGIVAVASEKPRLNADELLRFLDKRQDPMIVVLEGVDDARNLGYVIRSADALGAVAVVLKRQAWDFDETEVTRPSGGAYERMPVAVVDGTGALLRLRERGYKLAACVAGGRDGLFTTDLTGKLALLIGGEKRGLSGAVRSICTQFLNIPTRGHASLSLTHAAAILLAEASRQRGLPGDTPQPQKSGKTKRNKKRRPKKPNPAAAGKPPATGNPAGKPPAAKPPAPATPPAV